MKLLWVEEVDLVSLGKKSGTKVFSACVSISDISSTAQELTLRVRDTSYLSGLDFSDKQSFLAVAQPTIKKLADDIFAKVEDSVTTDFGEYLVSDTAQTLLEQQFNHAKLPLAEIIKPRKSGNEAFDFHTTSPYDVLTFGEAKYSATKSPYKDALDQIVDFINLKKDLGELIVLKHFTKNSNAVNNAAAGKKSYAAAFLINAKDPKKIIENSLSHIDDLLGHEELYLIGVTIDGR